MTMAQAGLSPAQLAANAWRFTPTGYAAKLGGLPAPKHVQLIGDALRDLVFGDDYDRLMIWMPPQHAKSTNCSLWLPVWYLDLFPHRQVLLASYAHRWARKWGWEVRNTILRHQDMLRVRLTTDFKARDQWYTTEGGGMATAGMDGGFTGYPGHLIVIDDPFKNWQEAHSEVFRDRARDVYRSVLYTRKHSVTKIVELQTRWHQDDLGGWLEQQSTSGEGDRYRVLILPALCEDPTTDPLGRHLGEALWPEMHSRESLLQTQKVVGTYFFTGMYQQRPAPEEGGILKRGWWKWYDVMPQPHDWDELLWSWDMAFKDADDSSYVVGQLWGRIGADKYLIWQSRDHRDFPATLKELPRVWDLWRKEGVDGRLKLVEDKANGPAVIQVLQGKIPGMVAQGVQGSKESRVRACSADVEGGNIWLPSPQHLAERRPDLQFPVMEFVDEASTFPNATHDDQVDAFTQAILRLGVDVEVTGEEDYLDMRLAGRR